MLKCLYTVLVDNVVDSLEVIKTPLHIHQSGYQLLYSLEPYVLRFHVRPQANLFIPAEVRGVQSRRVEPKHLTTPWRSNIHIV